MKGAIHLELSTCIRVIARELAVQLKPKNRAASYSSTCPVKTLPVYIIELIHRE
jgi:hypothetical protein